MNWTINRGVATAVALLVLFLPLILGFFENELLPYDLNEVFLVHNCRQGSTQTIFIFHILEVLIAASLLGRFTAPAIFGDKRWEEYDAAKRLKMVGNLVKIVVRLVVIILLLMLVMDYFDMHSGLFAELNAWKAAEELKESGRTVSCSEAGATTASAESFRAWVSARSFLMAVMAWELVAVPGLGVDLWLHHIFVILGVTIGIDPLLPGRNPDLQPLVDGMAFFLVLGGSLAAFVEVFVLMYHLTAPNPRLQAMSMLASLITQSILVPTFFLILPVWLAVTHSLDIGAFYGTVLLSILLFLVIVEARLIIVKVAIVKKALGKQRKIEQQELSKSTGTSELRDQTDMDKEAANQV
jgi:hypothetical protein